MLPEFEAAGTTLIAVSPQTAENVRAGVAAERLTFEMLVDQGNKVARERGLVFKLPDYFKDWYLGWVIAAAFLVLRWPRSERTWARS